MPLSQLTFRTKLLASHVGLVAVVVAIAILLLNRALGADLAAQLDRRLEEQARGAAAWVGEGRRHPDKLAGRIALIVSATVTIFDKDGKVLGDSASAASTAPSASTASIAPTAPTAPTPAADLPPEVVAAQHGDAAGRASRVTEAGEMHYVAVAAGDGLIIRLGAPLSGINATVREMQRQLLGASGIALALALALGFLAARVASEPLRAMTASATRLMRGDYDLEPLPHSPDEFGLLSRTLSSLAAELKSKIGDLTRERDRLSAILAGMAEGVLVTDEDGKILLANPAASKILGAELPAGAALADVIASPELLGFIEAAKASGEIREEEIETHDRGDRTIALYVRPLGTASLRSPRGLVTVLRDLTRLVHLMELRRDFVANVSHELRTPVTSIQGYAETLLRGTTDAATTRQFLEIIHRQSQRIGQLVTGLLSLSELEARPADEAIREPVLLTAVADAVKDTVRTRLAEAQTTLTVDIPDDLRVLGDPSGVEQVLLNLVDNAIKYGKRDDAEGRIVVSATREAKTALLRIADFGPGIEAHHLPRLFERFYRVDAGRSRDRGGSGLGLAIVKHLVESMGGRIEVTSDVGAGATFQVRLPLAS